MGRSKINRSEAEKQKIKNESRKRHQHGLRRAMAVSDYLLLTATDQHRQATEFVEKLEEKYPGKRDVRKTVEFRKWQREQLMNNKQPSATQSPQDQDNTINKKEMVLRIPLMNADTEAKQIPSVSLPGETQEDGLTSIFDEIPADVLDEMMAEIRADPALSAIINDFNYDLYEEEEVLDEATVQENMCLDIEFDERLEDELNSLLYF